MYTSKNWWDSKTVWFGFLEGVIAILVLLSGDQLIAENPTTVAVLGVAAGVLTIVLRAVTNQPLRE